MMNRLVCRMSHSLFHSLRTITVVLKSLFSQNDWGELAERNKWKISVSKKIITLAV